MPKSPDIGNRFADGALASSAFSWQSKELPAMKISIVTICFNAEATIADTIASVLAQSHPELEYWIIDGKSRDRTLDIVAGFPKDRINLVSEPDKGIYDAMNKGLARATGDAVAFLNADDVYSDANVVSNVIAAFDRGGTDCVFGDLDITERNDLTAVLQHLDYREFTPAWFGSGRFAPHPSTFIRTDFYRRHGGFDTSFRIAADMELFFRFVRRHSMTFTHVPRTLVKMRSEGVSNSASWKNRLRARQETWRAMRMHGIAPDVGYFAGRLKTKFLSAFTGR